MPSIEGAQQPEAGGDLISEDDACDRLRAAAAKAYEDLGCPAADLAACPGFLRPGGGSGCYEYREGSVDECVKQYEDAASCRTLAPCIATAVLNTALPTCEQPIDGSAGAGGAPVGGAGGGGGETPGVGGMTPEGGTGGVPSDTGGAPPDNAGGAPAPI